VKAPGYPSVLTGSAASATKVGTGKTVTLQAVLRDGRDQQVLANRPVALQTRTRGTTTWRTVATAQTTASGAVSAAVAIPYSTEARWVFAGAGQFEPTTGRTVTVNALPTLTLCCSTTIKLGKSYTFTDSISAKKSGLVLTLQRKSGTTWKTAATCKTSSSGTCKITVKPTKTGTYSYRLYRAGDSLLLGATSSTRTLKVVK
jgi:hypothetical protein